MPPSMYAFDLIIIAARETGCFNGPLTCAPPPIRGSLPVGVLSKARVLIAGLLYRPPVAYYDKLAPRCLKGTACYLDCPRHSHVHYWLCDL